MRGGERCQRVIVGRRLGTEEAASQRLAERNTEKNCLSNMKMDTKAKKKVRTEVTKREPAR